MRQRERDKRGQLYSAVLHVEPHYSTIVFFFTIVAFYNTQWRGHFGLNGKRMVKGAYIGI